MSENRLSTNIAVIERMSKHLEAVERGINVLENVLTPHYPRKAFRKLKANFNGLQKRIVDGDGCVQQDIQTIEAHIDKLNKELVSFSNIITPHDAFDGVRKFKKLVPKLQCC